MLSFPRSEPTDEGKPQTHGRLGSAHELDVDPIDKLALYHRQRRLRILVFAVLASAVVLLVVAAVRQTAHQLSTSPDATAGIDSGAPASQATTAEAAPEAPAEPSPLSASSGSSPAPQPRHHRAPAVPRPKRSTFPRTHK